MSYGQQPGYEQPGAPYNPGPYSAYAPFGGAPTYAATAHAARASWGSRAGGAVLDVLIAAPGYGLGLILADATGSPVSVDPNTFAVRGGPDDRCLAVGVLAILLIWGLNLLRQGRTGSSLGQRAFGVRIARQTSGEPLGFGLAVGHYLAHLLDLPLLLGFLCIELMGGDRGRTETAGNGCAVPRVGEGSCKGRNSGAASPVGRGL